MFWWKPYEALMEKKPQSGKDVLVDMLAKELVEMWEVFPPAADTIDWSDERTEAKYKDIWAEMPKLTSTMVAMLVKIVGLDLQHDNDQLDWLMRNDQHRDAFESQRDVDALLLLWPAVVEHLYQRKDDCKGIVNRADLLDVLLRAEERFRRGQLRVS
jgi:hypothetical protein